MPWQEVTTVSIRREFVMLAQKDGRCFSQLCKSFGISTKTGYKWLNRFLALGEEGLYDLSRKPRTSPIRTDGAIEAAILKLREKHPAWGGRKLKGRLEKLGYRGLPAPSTITEILRRHDLLDPAECLKHKPFIRFEHENPNDLWQIDFKGHIPAGATRCHPLTALDDNSRFVVVLVACPDEKTDTVKSALIDAFRRYGLPRRMTMDNGSPWGNCGPEDLTPLTAWLIRNNIAVSHSRPYHPQTQGKDERFHRTLNVELLRAQQFRDLEHCQREFDIYRDVYNMERPHQSLAMEPPISRYQPSNRAYSERLPDIEYGPGDQVRKVQAKGEVSFNGKTFKVPKALRGHPVAFRPTTADGIYSIFFCQHKLMEISLREQED